MSTTTRPRRKLDYSRPLTREKLAAAAIEIVRSEGQAALSMRKLASRFGVDVAALYRHFRNKDELLEHVGRMAADLAEIEAPTKGSFEDRFVALGRDIRRRIAEHPELGIYGSASPWATPFFARANGRIADLLREVGLEGEELVYATQTVLHLITSIAQSEVMAANTPREMNRAFARSIHEQLSEETREVWPSTRARSNRSVDFDAFFEYALRSTMEAVVPS